MSKIEGKIAQIRKQPEHIRMRWVWGCVLVSMAIIFFIWILSLRVSLREDVLNSSGSISDISERFSETFNGEDEPSLTKIIQDSKETIDETKAVSEALQEAEDQQNLGGALDSILGTPGSESLTPREAPPEIAPLR